MADLKKNIYLQAAIISVLFFIIASPVLAQSDFLLGVEYTINGVCPAEDNKTMAQIYYEMGARLTKPIDATARMDRIVGDVPWKNDLDPLAGLDTDNACSNTSAYNRALIDNLVLEYQAAGFELLIVLSPVFKVADPWPWKKSNKPPSMYSPIEENCYRNYVRNIVERYDMDGAEDMPGLLKPVRYWQIEEEYLTGFFDNPVGSSVWKDPAEEYIRLLKLAKPAIDEAYSNPDPENSRKIISIPLQMRGIFWYKSDQQMDEQIETYVSNYKTLLDNSTDNDINVTGGPRKILDLLLGRYPDLGPSFEEMIDIVSFNVIDDWKAGVLGPIRFINRMNEEFKTPKPIWVSDLNHNVDPMLYLWGYRPRAVPPYADSQVSAIIAHLNILNEGTYGKRAPDPSDPDNPANPKNKKYQEYLDRLAWHYALQARFTAKSIVIAMGEGGQAMDIFGTHDWGWRKRPAYNYVGTYGWCGMVDVTNIQALGTGAATVAEIGPGEDIMRRVFSS